MARSTSSVQASGRRKARRLKRAAVGRMHATGELVGRVAGLFEASTTAASGAKRRLDKTETYETRPLLPQVSREVVEKRVDQRYYLLGGLRKHSTKKNVRQCKTPIGMSHVGLVGHGDSSGGAHFTGVQSCANVWCCSVCGPKIRAGRTADVLEAFRCHTEGGGGFVFLTVTMPHLYGDRLRKLVGLLTDAWTYVTRQRGFKAWRERAGLVGNVTALEVTYGDNGWHPHRHIMLFTERPLSRDMVAAWEAELHALYNRYLAKQGWKASKDHVGVRMDYVRDARNSQALARYVTKLQAAFELTRSDLKRSRAAKGLMPFDLLEQAMDGDDDSRRLWQEYEQAMTGRSAIRFSKGLRDALAMGDEVSDEELAAEPVGETATLYLSAPLFRRLTRDGYRGQLLVLYGRKGDAGVLRLVQALYPGQYIAADDQLPDAVLVE